MENPAIGSANGSARKQHPRHLPNSPRTVEPRNTPAGKDAKSWITRKVAESKKLGKPISEPVVLDVERAYALLESNPDNRAISQLNLDRITRDIEDGLWQLNGQTLVVSDDGKLSDGQHRCWGVIEAGTAIETFIVWGAGRASRFTLDQGLSRSLAQYITMSGHSSAKDAATVVVYVYQWRTRNRLSPQGLYMPTKPAGLELLEANPEIFDSLKHVTQHGAAKIQTSRTLLAFCHFAINENVGRKEADRFMDRLIDGTDMRKGDPIYVCRERLLLGTRKKLSPNDRAEIIFRAFNHYNAGTRTSQLKATGGELPELGA